MRSGVRIICGYSEGKILGQPVIDSKVTPPLENFFLTQLQEFQ